MKMSRITKKQRRKATRIILDCYPKKEYMLNLNISSKTNGGLLKAKITQRKLTLQKQLRYAISTD